MYGMKLSQLTPELMDELLDIYVIICGGNIDRQRRNSSKWFEKTVDDHLVAKGLAIELPRR